MTTRSPNWKGMSDATRWRQADAIFDRLLDLPEAERGPSLLALAPDPETLAAVERLLAGHARAHGPLEDLGALPMPTGASATALAGRRLGRWRLEAELGRGGMSVVYRAHSESPPLGQQAAVKVLTLGAIATGGLERFRREQRVLARLNHPHLAQLHDVGVAEDGTPWLAMALVEGERIDAWCRSNALDVPSVVRLFLDVCRAVAHAHRALVIHRDLKPSNVLVDESGHVRVLDFGIAHLADAEDAPTRTEWRALSPYYAAPEQFSAAPASTAMDVYGLGALLYQLLCGRPPRTAGAEPGAEVTLPSRAVLDPSFGDDAARHARRRALAGDLDAVLMRALDPAPEQRYAGAAEFAADLERWLEGRPVAAVPAGRAYLLRRFIARHTGVVAVSALLLIAILAGLATTLWQAAVARREAERATRVRDFLAQVFTAAVPRDGSVPSALQILEVGSRMAKSELAADHPQAAADVLSITGNARRSMSDFDGALADLELARRLLGERGETESAEYALVEIELSRIQRNRGRVETALEHARVAQAVATRVAMPESERLAIAVSLASAETQAQDYAVAEARLRAVLDEVGQRGLTGGELQRDALNALATTLALAGRPLGERIAVQEERLRAFAALEQSDPSFYAYTLADVLPVFRRAEQYERAEALGRKALATVDRVHREPHMFVAVAACNLAWVLLDTSRPREAAALFDRSIEVDARIGRADQHARSCRYGRALALLGLGRLDTAAADLAAARALVDEHTGQQASALVNQYAAEATLLLRRGEKGLALSRIGAARDAHRAAGDAPAPRALVLAEAELALAEGDAAAAEGLLAPLRAQLPPHPRSAHWVRPWALSYLDALAANDAAGAAALATRLQAAVIAMPDDNELKPVLARCLELAGTDPRTCAIGW
jgi:serine/threonine-protein kinase